MSVLIMTNLPGREKKLQTEGLTLAEAKTQDPGKRVQRIVKRRDGVKGQRK